LFEDADRVVKPEHADLIVTDLTGFLRQVLRASKAQDS
jgi:hypothetical protein